MGYDSYDVTSITCSGILVKSREKPTENAQQLFKQLICHNCEDKLFDYQENNKDKSEEENFVSFINTNECKFYETCCEPLYWIIQEKDSKIYKGTINITGPYEIDWDDRTYINICGNCKKTYSDTDLVDAIGDLDPIYSGTMVILTCTEINISTSANDNEK